MIVLVYIKLMIPGRPQCENLFLSVLIIIIGYCFAISGIITAFCLISWGSAQQHDIHKKY